jgi:hypothetical protein
MVRPVFFCLACCARRRLRRGEHVTAVATTAMGWDGPRDLESKYQAVPVLSCVY